MGYNSTAGFPRTPAMALLGTSLIPRIWKGVREQLNCVIQV
jgi:hypothetical protein